MPDSLDEEGKDGGVDERDAGTERNAHDDRNDFGQFIVSVQV
jgi:hypothetical protein